MSAPSLVHVVAVTSPFYAVFTDPEGNPDIRRVVAMGTFQVGEEARVLAGFPLGHHLMAADWMAEFVGYSDTAEPAPWVDRCKTRRQKLTEAEAEQKAKPQIIVPDNAKNVGDWLKMDPH